MTPGREAGADRTRKQWDLTQSLTRTPGSTVAMRVLTLVGWQFRIWGMDQDHDGPQVWLTELLIYGTDKSHWTVKQGKKANTFLCFEGKCLQINYLERTSSSLQYRLMCNVWQWYFTFSNINKDCNKNSFKNKLFFVIHWQMPINGRSTFHSIYILHWFISIHFSYFKMQPFAGILVSTPRAASPVQKTVTETEIGSLRR